MCVQKFSRAVWQPAAPRVIVLVCLSETCMAQNKRQHLQIRVASDPYLAELNRTDRYMKLQSPLQFASTDSSVATTRESGIAASQCCDAYLDQLNQQLEDGGKRYKQETLQVSADVSARAAPRSARDMIPTEIRMLHPVMRYKF